MCNQSRMGNQYTSVFIWKHFSWTCYKYFIRTNGEWIYWNELSKMNFYQQYNIFMWVILMRQIKAHSYSYQSINSINHIVNIVSGSARTLKVQRCLNCSFCVCIASLSCKVKLNSNYKLNVTLWINTRMMPFFSTRKWNTQYPSVINNCSLILWPHPAN